MAETARKLKVTIVTPSGVKEEYDVRHARAPGSEGDFGVLPGHLPFMTGLRIGAIRLDTDTGQVVWATVGGYVEVLDDVITILAENADRADRIDVARAEAARERALGRLHESGTGLDVSRAHLALARALNRLHVASGV